MRNLLAEKIYQQVLSNPNHCAIWVDGVAYTYADLFKRSYCLGQFLKNKLTAKSCGAIYSRKSIHAYESILASILYGQAYLPLNPHFPMNKNLQMLESSNAKVIFIDADFSQTRNLLQSLSSLSIIVFSQTLYEFITNNFPQHDCFFFNKLNINDAISKQITWPNLAEDAKAYLMFTSGSTGLPKGIGVSYANLYAYISEISKLFLIKADDRLSQFSEITFDVSVHEIFISWFNGGSLFVLPENYIFGIKKFIQKHALTVWMAVPSNVTLLHELKQLAPNCFPSLRLSFFCGEAFLTSQAKLWREIAPNTKIYNLYGPTEATGSFTYFYCDENFYSTKLACVPIGQPYANQSCEVIDSDGQLVPTGEVGELCLAGSQVVDGYWNNDLKTEQQFKKFQWDVLQRTWYCTGDLARCDLQYGLIYHGRLDDQWQIRGYRVEKLEIEITLRKIANNNAIAVLPIKDVDNAVIQLAAFVHASINIQKMLSEAKTFLPSVMIPQRVVPLAILPLNQNGKIDYSALQVLLSELDCHSSIVSASI